MNSLPYDPAAIFAARKAIYDTVKTSQLEEHHAIARMGEVSIDHKRQLLELLSTWLLSQRQRTVAVSSQNLLAATGVSLQEWCTLQREADDYATKIAAALGVEKVAEQAYWAKCPLGVVTQVFASNENAPEISRLKNDADAKRSHRQSLESSLKTNVSRREQIGEQFLRNAMQNLDAVCEQDTIGRQAQQVIAQMSAQMKAAWEPCNNREKQRVADMIDNLRTIKEMTG